MLVTLFILFMVYGSYSIEIYTITVAFSVFQKMVCRKNLLQ